MPIVVEPGLDLHEWETRWQELEEAAADAPDEALPEIVRLVGEMMAARGLDLKEPVTAEGADVDLVRDYLAARDVANAVEAGNEPDDEDIAVALDDLREIYEYLVSERAAP
jgi:hypothetical protein